MPSAIDPTFPADGTPVSKPAFRDQLLTLRAELDHGGFVTNPVTLAESTTSQALADLHGVMATPRVGTIAELRGIPPAPGLAVEVLGYHAPGDGGGGLFYADMTGARPTDGGIVFGHAADESAEQSVTGIAADDLGAPYALPHQDIVFGSVVLESEEAGTTLHISDLDLHGHRMNSGGVGIVPWFRHQEGQVNDTHYLIRNYYLSRPTTTWKVRYKYLTNPRRWVRQTDGEAVHLKWWGAQEGTDARNLLCWALNAAKQLGRRRVVLGGAYRYRGSIEIPNGVTLGWGSLRITDGNAVLPLRTDYDTTHPYSEAVTVLGAWGHGIYPEDDATFVGLEDLELDGNYEGNTDPLLNSETAYDGERAGLGTGPGSFQAALQNTPIWSGVSFSPHGGRNLPEDCRPVLRNVSIHGYGSNCIVGNGNAVFSATNVQLGNSARNHLFYSIHGSWDGLVLWGFSWNGMGKTEHCTFHDLHVERLALLPTDWAWSAGSSPHVIVYEGLRWGPELTGYDAIRWQRIGLNISGFHLDLEGYTLHAGPLFLCTGPHVKIRDGVIIGPSAHEWGEIELIRESFIGDINTSDSGLYAGWNIENVTLLQRSGAAFSLTTSRDLNSDQAGFRNIVIEEHRGDAGAVPDRGALFGMIAAEPRPAPQWGQGPRHLQIEGVTAKPAAIMLARVDVTDPNAYELDVTIRDCVFPLLSSLIYKTESGTGGEVSGMTVPDTDKIKVFMERTRFSLVLTVPQNLELFFALTRFRNCTTMDGLTSEDGGVADLVAAGGETVLDVPTGLFWAPAAVHVTPRSAAAAARFAWVEVLASDGLTAIEAAADRRSPVLRLHFDQPLGAGDTIALAWDAAVRPF